MKKYFKIAFAVLFAVCTACTQDGNNRDLVLVLNHEWSFPAPDKEYYICRSSFDAEISDIQLSKHRNTYKYTVRFKDPLTKIEEHAFEYSSLTSVTIPNSVTKIGKGAFRGCTSLTSVTIPTSVTEIGEDAFSSCISLTSVKIPDSVTKIGASAFYNCRSLTSVTIPNSVTEIEDSAFSGCSSLASFKGKYASKDGRSLIIDGELRFFAGAGLVKYKIPDSVTKIEKNAFKGRNGRNLTSVTIPDSVTEIGEEVFRGCRSLTSVTIPNSVTKIGKYAFSDCTSLTSVTIPDSVTEIGECAFEYSSLTSVTIPNSVTKIGEYAFLRCKSLTSVTILGPVTKIEYGTFQECNSLSSVTILGSVTEIEDSAFYHCESLTSVTIPNSVKKIGDSAFDWCKSLTSVRLPRGVILASDSFYYKTKLEYSNEYSHTGEAVVFQNWQSVLPYLSSRVFRSEDGRSRVKIETRGVFLNGRQVADAPEIISVSETYAVIHAAIPPHSRYRFGVLPQEGCIVDLNDNSRYYCE